MSNPNNDKVMALYEFPNDDPLREPVIETLLWVLQEVRMGRICSVGIVGVSEDFARSITWGEGVRVDQIPHINGLLGMLQSELKDEYDSAIESVSEPRDI